MNIEHAAEQTRPPLTRSRRVREAIGSTDIPFVTGVGRWALVLACQHPTEARLFRTYADAAAAKERLSAFRCCPRCRGLHTLVQLPEDAHVA
jgi:hypothetical protein